MRAHARELSASWVAAENLHLTLKFLGGVDEARVPAVIDALRAAVAGHRPFEIEVTGLGAFPSAARPRVLWAGVTTGHEAMTTLADAVETALARLGFPREDRAFSPHITFARIREQRRAPALAEALSIAATQRFGRVTVREVTLMRSDLSPRGARYTPLASAPLGG